MNCCALVHLKKTSDATKAKAALSVMVVFMVMMIVIARECES